MAEGLVTNKKDIYEKKDSFESFFSNIASDQNEQRQRCLDVLKQIDQSTLSEEDKGIVEALIGDLSNTDSAEALFKINEYISDEVSKLEGDQIVRYLIYRYRYDVYPRKKKLSKFPPYLQIEPTSVCNFRCVFCYQSDMSFSVKTSGHMGSMSVEMFKSIIDQCVGNVEFFSLASRGEPMVCKDIDKMLEYTVGKFLGLKINTNASLLNEKHCHAILAGGVSTLVFSADAAEEPLYSQLRVGGNLDKVLKNVELFNTIRSKHYSKSKIITRVSGVKVNEQQGMDSMKSTWASLVDQLSFVKYNPWENVYDSPVNDVKTPCSDLWRRMFVWYDGKTNPCDTDYKSALSVGNVSEESLSELWHSKLYESLRKKHVEQSRGKIEPCRRCTVV